MNDIEKEKPIAESEARLSDDKEAAEHSAGSEMEPAVSVSDLLQRIDGLEKRIAELTVAHETHREQLDHAYTVLGIPPKVEEAPTFVQEEEELTHLRDEEAALVTQERALEGNHDAPKTAQAVEGEPVSEKSDAAQSAKTLASRTDTSPRVESKEDMTRLPAKERVADKASDRRHRLDLACVRGSVDDCLRSIDGKTFVAWEDARLITDEMDIQARESAMDKIWEIVNSKLADYRSRKTKERPIQDAWLRWGKTSLWDRIKGNPVCMCRLDLYINNEVYPIITPEEEFAKRKALIKQNNRLRRGREYDAFWNKLEERAIERKAKKENRAAKKKFDEEWKASERERNQRRKDIEVAQERKK